MTGYTVCRIGQRYGIIDHLAFKLVEDAVGIALFPTRELAERHIFRLTDNGYMLEEDDPSQQGKGRTV